MPTVTLEGTLSFPLGAEADPPDRPFKAQLVYAKRSVQDVDVTGAAEGASNLMGAMAEAKLAYVELVSGDGTITANGGSPIDLAAAGGLWFWFSPNGGLTSLIAETAGETPMRLRTYLFF